MNHIDLAGYPSNDAAVSCFLGQFCCRCRTAGPLMCLISMRHSTSVGLCFHLLRSDEMKSRGKAVPVIRWTLTISSAMTYVWRARRFGSVFEICFSCSCDTATLFFFFMWYSDSLRAGRSGDRIPKGARFSAPVQTGSEAHPASYTMGTGSFPGVKRPGRGVDYPLPSSTEIKDGVELYLCSTSGPSWPVLGCTYDWLLLHERSVLSQP